MENVPLSVTTLRAKNQSENAQLKAPLVMLHGWGKNSNSFIQIAKFLNSERDIHLIDLPGFGNSPLPIEASNAGSGWGTNDYAGCLTTWLNLHCQSGYIVLGHSFGGRIALRLAVNSRGKVAGLILIGSHGIPRPRTGFESFRVKLIQKIGATLKRIDSLSGSSFFKDYFTPRFGSKDYLAAGEMRKTLVKTVNEDQRESIKTINAPTLLLWGENDTETPIALGRQLSFLIANSQFHSFPGLGHEPFNDVAGHLMVRYIKRFLKNVGI